MPRLVTASTGRSALVAGGDVCLQAAGLPPAAEYISVERRAPTWTSRPTLPSCPE
jgi:hypothetical protein